MMCIDLLIVRRHRMSVLFCCWDLQLCRTESLQLADICSTVGLFCDTREVELQGTKKANGVLRDILLRLYQGVLCFEYGVRLYGIHVSLISCKPVRKVWSSLRRLSKRRRYPASFMQLWSLLGVYAAQNGNVPRTFRDLQALSSRVKLGPVGCPETSITLPLYDV